MTKIAFALVLMCAAIIAAILAGRVRKTQRQYLIFAAALYASLAVGEAVATLAHAQAQADAIALIVSALAPASLALAMTAPRTIVATLVLLLCLVCGIFAAMSGEALAAFAPLFASVCVLLVVALRERRLYAAASAFCFLMASASFMMQAQTGLALFSAAGLIGVSLALSDEVASQGKSAGRLAIGRQR